MKNKLITTDFDSFIRKYPDWENTPAGTPQYLVRMSDTEWMLHPAPTTALTNLPMTIIGSVLPTPATDVNTSPPVSLALHSCYVHFISWKAFLLLNNPERAAQEFKVYDALRTMNTKTATSTTGSQQSFKMV